MSNTVYGHCQAGCKYPVVPRSEYVKDTTQIKYMSQDVPSTTVTNGDTLTWFDLFDEFNGRLYINAYYEENDVRRYVSFNGIILPNGTETVETYILKANEQFASNEEIQLLIYFGTGSPDKVGLMGAKYNYVTDTATNIDLHIAGLYKLIPDSENPLIEYALNGDY